MMDFRNVDIDVERIRAQMSDELDEEVTDIEVIVWLRRCGFVQHNGRWVADVSVPRPLVPAFGPAFGGSPRISSSEAR